MLGAASYLNTVLGACLLPRASSSHLTRVRIFLSQQVDAAGYARDSSTWAGPTYCIPTDRYTEPYEWQDWDQLNAYCPGCEESCVFGNCAAFDTECVESGIQSVADLTAYGTVGTCQCHNVEDCPSQIQACQCPENLYRSVRRYSGVLCSGMLRSLGPASCRGRFIYFRSLLPADASARLVCVRQGVFDVPDRNLHQQSWAERRFARAGVRHQRRLSFFRNPLREPRPAVLPRRVLLDVDMRLWFRTRQRDRGGGAQHGADTSGRRHMELRLRGRARGHRDAGTMQS